MFIYMIGGIVFFLFLFIFSIPLLFVKTQSIEIIEYLTAVIIFPCFFSGFFMLLASDYIRYKEIV